MHTYRLKKPIRFWVLDGFEQDEAQERALSEVSFAPRGLGQPAPDSEILLSSARNLIDEDGNPLSFEILAKLNLVDGWKAAIDSVLETPAPGVMPQQGQSAA